MTFKVDGANGLTFPNNTTQASAGQVLQVVNSTWVTAVSSTSSSWSTTGFSATITPKFSTSKILVIFNLCACRTSNAGNGGQHTIYRNGTTNLGASGTGFDCIGFNQSATTDLYNTIPMIWLDSPATTSATTYASYFRTNSGTVSINAVGVSTVTLKEIAQ